MKRKKGLVYVFTGSGKGKTSAAIGVGVRAALSGMRVAMVCWYKESRWQISELKITNKIRNFKIYLSGKGFYKLPTDHATEKEHRIAAGEALDKAKSLLGKVDVLILDEVNNAMSDKLVKVAEVLKLIKSRGATHLVLTGRNAPKTVVRLADLVTDMQKVKHPFDKGMKAVKGLDF